MKLAILIALALSACVAPTQITQRVAVRPNTAQVEQIKATITRDFFDPSSAQFRDIRVVDLVLSDGTKARRVCGEVNGKNRLGGYVGFKMFGGEIVGGRFVQQDFFGACEAW